LECIRGTSALSRRLVRPVLTIGNFDGLHLGHRAIMETVISRARDLGGEAVVYTFEPHPRKVIQPGRAPWLLITLDQKLELLEGLGVDVTIVEHFDESFRRVEPETFVTEYIHERIRPVEVYVGYDFHYGRDREGSMRLLTERGPLLGFAVTIIPEVKVGDHDVNSTRIRDLLGVGDVEEVRELLGRSFSIRGAVVEGARRGRTIGFPTANLSPENEVLPAAGVYAGELRFIDDGEPEQDTRHPVVTNVGVRPTFRDGQGLLAEAHLIDFEAEIYGRRVELGFSHRLRAEQKFPNTDALREQIAKDVAEARLRLGSS
jgi:riboflavin kinase/FMN adenylyltransferase